MGIDSFEVEENLMQSGELFASCTYPSQEENYNYKTKNDITSKQSDNKIQNNPKSYNCFMRHNRKDINDKNLFCLGKSQSSKQVQNNFIDSKLQKKEKKKYEYEQEFENIFSNDMAIYNSAVQQYGYEFDIQDLNYSDYQKYNYSKYENEENSIIPVNKL